MIKKLKFLFTIVAFAGCYWACSPKVKGSKETASVENQLKVMSYNIHHANPPSKPGLIDLDAVAAVIKRENPDIVGLQEVDRFTKRSGNIDEAKLLGEKTGLHYQFFKAIAHDGGDYGVAILSKFPIKDPVTVALPQVIKAEDRVLAYATLTLSKNLSITFANTHLDATRIDSNRVVQMKTILAELSKKDGPVLVMGDLNCESKAQPIVLLDQQFKRSCVNNCAFTIPQNAPRKTIDYIAIKNANWNVLTHTVIAETYASDHRPVVAVYQIK